jgi:hypothetical protein
MTIDELFTLTNKFFFEANMKNLTSVEQLALEIQWTEFLINVVKNGNRFLLKNFGYRLSMEDDDN